MENGIEAPSSAPNTPTDAEQNNVEQTENEAQEKRKEPLRPRALLRGPITYEEADYQDANILHELSYVAKRDEFFGHLDRNYRTIRALAAHHLRLPSKACEVGKRKDWIHGSFNVCIPILTDNRDYFMRFPLPYRVGEGLRKGNADEKLRCEVATYAFMQKNCPDVRIPFLYGFGLSDGKTMTHIEQTSMASRVSHRLRQKKSSNDWGFQTRYVETTPGELTTLGSPYLLIEYIEPEIGDMLALTWQAERSNESKRHNLFRGLCRIMLQLVRHPLPKIGSLTIDDQGRASLSNRPLKLMVQQSENENFQPTGAVEEQVKSKQYDSPNKSAMNGSLVSQHDFYNDRRSTHTSMDSYINDVLHDHERRLRCQPNGIRDLVDGATQLTDIVLLRSIWPRFFTRNLRQGPFYLTLTDMNSTNLFVDDDWNITAVVDLEWACSLPIEMIHPPSWLSTEFVDCITPEDYEPLHSEFVRIFGEEEARLGNGNSLGTTDNVLHPIMASGLERGTFWVSLALSSPSALFKICEKHIFPRFYQIDPEDSKFFAGISAFWDIGAHPWLRQRSKDCEQYNINLLEAFKSTAEDQNSLTDKSQAAPSERTPAQDSIKLHV